MRRYSAEEIASIARACELGRRLLRSFRTRCVPGATGEVVLDVCRHVFCGDPGVEFGPGTISINEYAANALPMNRPFTAGDLVTVDLPLARRGWWGDQARSFVVRPPACAADSVADARADDAARRHLTAAAKRVTACCIANCRPDARWRDIRVAAWAEANRLGVRLCRGLAGHGIGRSMHEEPALGYHAGPWDGVVLEPGMVFTVEPVVTAGSGETVAAADGPSVLTADGQDAACDERTVAVTGSGVWVL